MNNNLAKREPVAVRAAITAAATAVLHVLVVLGILDADLETALAGAVDAIGVVVLILVVRPAVVPADAVVARQDPRTGVVEAGKAAPLPTGLPVRTVLSPAKSSDANVTARQDPTFDR